MRRNLNLTAGLLLLSIFLSFGAVYAAEKMTYEEYQMKLSGFQDREATALLRIETERGVIADLKEKIRTTEETITDIWQEILTSLGKTEDDYVEHTDNLKELESQVSTLERLNPEVLFERADDIDDLMNQVSEIKSQSLGTLTVSIERTDKLLSKLERLKRNLPKPKSDTYVVVRGDYLWKISGKDDIYGDPWKWMRIYSANREEIKDPDLIYPDQQFKIPRQIGRDQHLVVRGDNLSKIAGYEEIYGDPFKWTKIYQANKANGFIEDPNVIYPEQILNIPQD